MKARDVMSTPVVTVPEDATLERVAKLMLEKRVGSMPVVDGEGRLVGIVTESDFAGTARGVPFSLFSLPSVFGRWFGKGEYARALDAARHLRAGEVMSRPVLTASEDDELETVIGTMVENDRKRIPIVRDGKPVGIVAQHDVLRAIVKP